MLLLAIVLAAFVAAALFFVWNRGWDGRVAAHSPHPGLDFSMGVDTNGDTTVDCNTTGGPAKCTFDSAGGTFVMNVFLNALGGVANYTSFNLQLNAVGVTVNLSNGVPVADAHSWPPCTFQAVSDSDVPGFLAFGCSAGFNVTSTYTGLIGTAEFTCTQTGTVTVVHGTAGRTFLGETGFLKHAEGQGTTEVLAINCGLGPTATPGGPTFTPTPTSAVTATPTITPTPTETPTPISTPSLTPTPSATPTPTRRPPHILLGDVDGDGTVSALDALWVLWADAQILPDVPIPEAADVDGDGLVSATDALFILWVDAGVLELL